MDWQGEFERITKLNNDLSSSIQEYDPNNSHPYDKLEFTKGADGKVTTAQVTLDPDKLAAGMAIGQIFGSALGGALGGNSLVGNLNGRRGRRPDRQGVRSAAGHFHDPRSEQGFAQ